MDFNFEKWKKAVATSGKKWRETVQQGLNYGLMQFADHGNAAPLTEVIEVVDELGIVSGKRLIDYVLSHAPSLEWTEKRFKKGEGEGTTRMPTVMWWQFKKETLPQEFDLVVQLNGLIKRASKAIEEGRFKGEAGKIEELRKLVA